MENRVVRSQGTSEIATACRKIGGAASKDVISWKQENRNFGINFFSWVAWFKEENEIVNLQFASVDAIIKCRKSGGPISKKIIPQRYSPPRKRRRWKIQISFLRSAEPNRLYWYIRYHKAQFRRTFPPTTCFSCRSFQSNAHLILYYPPFEFEASFILSVYTEKKRRASISRNILYQVYCYSSINLKGLQRRRDKAIDCNTIAREYKRKRPVSSSSLAASSFRWKRNPQKKSLAMITDRRTRGIGITLKKWYFSFFL